MSERGGLQDLTVVQQMISSCTGALLTSVLVTPLDVVKIRLQAQRKPFTRGKCFLYCNGLMDHLCICLNGSAPRTQSWYKRTVPSHFSGTIDAMIKLTRHEGIASLWSGLPPTLVMAIPATVVYFTCYEQCRSLFGYSGGLQGNDWWKPILAGASARTVAVTVISPMEMVRTKMQSEQLKYREIMTAVRHMVAVGGWTTLYKGLVPTLLRDVPFSALYWVGYESMKSYVMRTRGTKEMSFFESFVSGALSGTIAGVLTLPFDVIKTHRQIELGQTINIGVNTTSSTFRLMQTLYAHEGIHALFTGLVPRVIKVAPACAIMISTYEHFKSHFRTQNQLARSKRTDKEQEDVS